jgi:hypothetical protein
MSIEITIGLGGSFAQIEVEQSDDVFWNNQDSNPHWPVPWCYGLKVAPQQSSNAFQAVPGGTLPQKLIYQDALSAQSGVMWVYADFQMASSPYTATAGPSASIPITTGGKSPYDTAKSTGVPSWISFAESTPDSSAGFNAVLTNPPPGSVTFNLNATDGLGKNIQQQVTITVVDPFELMPGPYNAHPDQTTSIPLAQGGQPPYSTSNDGVPFWVTLAQATSGSAGVFAVVTNPPAGGATFDFNATDTLGNNINQKITINVS